MRVPPGRPDGTTRTATIEVGKMLAGVRAPNVRRAASAFVARGGRGH